jgi:hypothetical protein
MAEHVTWKPQTEQGKLRTSEREGQPVERAGRARIGAPLQTAQLFPWRQGTVVRRAGALGEASTGRRVPRE